MSALLGYIDVILVFPRARRRPNGFADRQLLERTLIAYEVDETSVEAVAGILGVFHGGQNWEAALGDTQGDPETGR